jgi:hypothetical protein
VPAHSLINSHSRDHRNRAPLCALRLEWLLSVHIQCVSKACPNGKYAPPLKVLHGRHLAEALNDRIIMHDDGGFEFADGRYRLYQRGGQIETAAFPISWEVLSAAVNRPIRLNLARTADANEGC